MAASATHRGWLNSRVNGILAATYNGAQEGAAVLATNTALSGVLVGTPVTPALAVDSLVISNNVASGDILIAANNGGNSQAWLWVDASAGTLTLYAAGVEQLRTALGAFVINEGSADVDTRVETNNLQYAIYADGGKDALVLGSNTDTSSADQLITVSRAARTATAATNYYDLIIAPAGAVTVPAGTTAVVASLAINEPNITATGTATRAATLYIASQPTEGGTANAAILFGAAANIAGTTSLTINEDSEDLDVRVETNGMAYAIYSDGGKDALVLGSNTDTSSADQLITVSRAARTATANVSYYDLRVAPAGAVTVPAGTTAVVATMSLVEPNVTATGTVTRAATLHIASQPTEGGTANAAIYFGAAANIAGTTSITFNEDSEDVDLRIESNGNANMFVLDAGDDAIGLGGAAVASQTVTITNAAMAATGRVLKLSATVAAAALTDGYGALEVDVTLSGSPTAHSAASSSWINITGGTVPVGTYICANNDGIYEASAATITNAKLIFGSRMHKLTDDTDALCFPFSLNTNNTAITALFDCQNRSDFGLVASAGTAENQLLPIMRDAAGNLRYVMLYTN